MASVHFVRSFIERYTGLSDTDWQVIEKVLLLEEVKKESIVLKEGEICRHLYFLEAGLLRFFILKNGEEVTKFFTEAPYAFTSQKSFTDKRPSEESIDALENSIIWRMKYDDASDLLRLPSWSEFIRKLVQEVQFFTEQILVELQTETAESRYRKMLEINHPLVQRVPLKYLASYFGIAPQSLSRIRNKITGIKL